MDSAGGGKGVGEKPVGTRPDDNPRHGDACLAKKPNPDQDSGLLDEAGEVRDGVIDCRSVQAIASLSLCLAPLLGSTEIGRIAWRMVWAAKGTLNTRHTSRFAGLIARGVWVLTLFAPEIRGQNVATPVSAKDHEERVSNPPRGLHDQWFHIVRAKRGRGREEPWCHFRDTCGRGRSEDPCLFRRQQRRTAVGKLDTRRVEPVRADVRRRRPQQRDGFPLPGWWPETDDTRVFRRQQRRRSLGRVDAEPGWLNTLRNNQARQTRTPACGEAEGVSPARTTRSVGHLSL
jgi:hypothetical protein